MRAIVSASGLIGAHQQFNLGGNVGVHRRQRYGVQAAGRLLLESGDRRLRRRACDQRRRAGGMQNPLWRKIVGIGIAGALAGNDAHAATRRNSLRGRLHQRLIHHQRGRGQVFEIKVGIVAARRKRGGEISLKIVVRKAVVGEEEALLVGSHHILMPLALKRLAAVKSIIPRAEREDRDREMSWTVEGRASRPSSRAGMNGAPLDRNQTISRSIDH